MQSATTIDPSRCRREQARAEVARPSTVRAGNALPRDVTVEDLSQAGFSFTSCAPIPVGTSIRIGLAGAGRACAQVTWHKGKRHGCRFYPPLTAAQVDAAFTHSLEASITRFGSALISDVVQETPTSLSPAARFAVIMGSGLLGWAIFALGMRSLSFF